MANIKDYTASVVNNRFIDDNISLIEFLLPGFDGKAEPGQFIMIKIDETYDPFLRRPYSILECKKEKVKILIKTVGRGSKMIVEKKRKEEMDILGPLGNGFPVDKNNHPILVAGGMGIAPLWFLTRRLTKLRKKFSMIYGEKTTTPLAEEINRTFGEKVFFVTDDGSRGIKLTASAALPLILDKSPYKSFSIYACGPKGMLKGVIDFGRSRNIPVYVSLEERMACGIGVCLGCSVKRRGNDGFLTICGDGPVFKGEEVMV